MAANTNRLPWTAVAGVRPTRTRITRGARLDDRRDRRQALPVAVVEREFPDSEAASREGAGQQGGTQAASAEDGDLQLAACGRGHVSAEAGEAPG